MHLTVIRLVIMMYQRPLSRCLDIATDKLTVEEATLYFGASNSDFATPLNNGPTYALKTAKNIVDGENNGSEARSGIFNASEVVANGLGPDLTVAETKSYSHLEILLAQAM